MVVGEGFVHFDPVFPQPVRVIYMICATTKNTELWNWLKVEVGVLGSPSLMALTVSVDGKQHSEKKKKASASLAASLLLVDVSNCHLVCANFSLSASPPPSPLPSPPHSHSPHTPLKYRSSQYSFETFIEMVSLVKIRGMRVK